MNRRLLNFTWKEITRSAAFGKSVATTIMLGFLAIYFAVAFLMAGFAIPGLLKDKYPDGNVVSLFNQFLLVYFGFDLVIRQLAQNLPTISFKPLIVLNVKRKQISRYLLFRSAFHFFNFLPYFLLVPVCFSLIGKEFDTISTLAWFLGLALMIFTSHFLTIYLKWWINESSYGFYVFAGIFAALYAVNYFGLVDLAALFGQLFDLILAKPFWVVALIIPLVLCYKLNDRYLRKNLYLNLVEQKQKSTTVRDFSWLSRMGEYGKFISLDIRMIWRNKRPRSQFFMSVIFLLYGLVIYKDRGNGVEDFSLILGGLFMVSMFSISFGQFFPAWHSRYFAMLMSQNFKMKQFLQAFYYMNVVVSFIYFLLTTPYYLIDHRIIYYNLVLLLYHLGVNMNLIFLFGKHSKRALDLSSSAMFNYQGVGASQWLIAFPLLFGPLLLYFLSKLLLGSAGALFVLGGAGALGILLQPYLFNYFSKAYIQHKYQLIRNYKNS